jgi:hypothetical protein
VATLKASSTSHIRHFLPLSVATQSSHGTVCLAVRSGGNTSKKHEAIYNRKWRKSEKVLYTSHATLWYRRSRGRWQCDVTDWGASRTVLENGECRFIKWILYSSRTLRLTRHVLFGPTVRPNHRFTNRPFCILQTFNNIFLYGHFNIILPFTATSPKCSNHIKFSNKNLSARLVSPCPLQARLFTSPHLLPFSNMTQNVQIMT